MLYKKNVERDLKKSLFKNPTSEYRATPFWAWNCELEQGELEWQIEMLKKMGFGGFHMHSRTGMATKYLSDDFMKLIRACVDKAEKENMLAWLYDEDRWPSGPAGGYVTKTPRFRQRMLIFSRNLVETADKETAVAEGGMYFIAAYVIARNSDGMMTYYRKVTLNEAAKVTCADDETVWYVYSACPPNSPWYNNITYVDTLCKDAMDKFIEVTHERYKECCGDQFDKVVPAIFTDEPQFQHKSTLNFGTDNNDVIMSWTPDLPETYMETYGADITDTLPELIWDSVDQPVSTARYRYHDHVAERFASAFADNIGAWCEKNGIKLTGHMMEEPWLISQTHATGDVMRSYRSFQLPGIDLLCDACEFTTAKQAQSAANQYGREGVLSELYGVTNWHFDFRGHKYQGDWQACLGITVRVPHLSWVSMGGEAKRDYPASISYQSPWFEKYKLIEDHFARVNTCMTRGVPVSEVAVIHPIESYWLHWGPRQSTSAVRDQMEENFRNVTDWLLFGNIDFDFVCESLLPGLYQPSDKDFVLGKMKYKTVVVPACETMRGTTLRALLEFANKGGDVLFLGDYPTYIDAVNKPEDMECLEQLIAKSRHSQFRRKNVLAALSCRSLVEIRNFDATRTGNLFYRLRHDNKCDWLFIAHGEKNGYCDMPHNQGIRIHVRGRYKPELYDTMTGEIRDIPYTFVKHGDGSEWTEINAVIFDYDSLMIRLNKADKNDVGVQGVYNVWDMGGKNLRNTIHFSEPVNYKLSEPNVVLLDSAEYTWDDEPYKAEEEILRADNQMRRALGWPLRGESIAQAWVLPDEPIEHTMKLRMRFDSEREFKDVRLAVEEAESVTITLNGELVPSVVDGYYTDKAIRTVKLPMLHKGENVLELSIPVNKKANVEWCYLLGDFGVRLDGTRKTLVRKPKKIAFASTVRQLMPFYGANITYNTEIDVEGDEEREYDLIIKANQYRGAMISVAFDGKPAGNIIFSPYCVRVKGVKPGKHKISFTCYGNRYNSFAPLHYADLSARWIGPNAWRSGGDAWTYDYMLKDMGMLISPVVEIFE